MFNIFCETRHRVCLRQALPFQQRELAGNLLCPAFFNGGHKSNDYAFTVREAAMENKSEIIIGNIFWTFRKQYEFSVSFGFSKK
jgi:hypothetical protein